jgi:hypothetical protein
MFLLLFCSGRVRAPLPGRRPNAAHEAHWWPPSAEMRKGWIAKIKTAELDLRNILFFNRKVGKGLTVGLPTIKSNHHALFA